MGCGYQGLLPVQSFFPSSSGRPLRRGRQIKRSSLSHHAELKSSCRCVKWEAALSRFMAALAKLAAADLAFVGWILELCGLSAAWLGSSQWDGGPSWSSFTQISDSSITCSKLAPTRNDTPPNPPASQRRVAQRILISAPSLCGSFIMNVSPTENGVWVNRPIPPCEISFNRTVSHFPAKGPLSRLICDRFPKAIRGDCRRSTLRRQPTGSTAALVVWCNGSCVPVIRSSI